RDVKVDRSRGKTTGSRAEDKSMSRGRLRLAIGILLCGGLMLHDAAPTHACCATCDPECPTGNPCDPSCGDPCTNEDCEKTGDLYCQCQGQESLMGFAQTPPSDSVQMAALRAAWGEGAFRTSGNGLDAQFSLGLTWDSRRAGRILFRKRTPDRNLASPAALEYAAHVPGIEIK